MAWAGRTAVKVKEAALGIDAQELSYIDIVGQRGRQPDNADHALCGLHLSRKAEVENQTTSKIENKRE